MSACLFPAPSTEGRGLGSGNYASPLATQGFGDDEGAGARAFDANDSDDGWIEVEAPGDVHLALFAADAFPIHSAIARRKRAPGLRIANGGGAPISKRRASGTASGAHSRIPGPRYLRDNYFDLSDGETTTVL